MAAADANSSPADSLAREYMLDSICDEFEAEWKRGSEPDLRQFLSDANEEHARELFEELVHVDMYYRRRRGEVSSIDGYIQRFPQYSSDMTVPRIMSGSDGASDSDRALQKVGDYELKDQIGAGSFGTVWRAWHPQLQRMDAIKLPQHGFIDPEQLNVLHHEARAAARLNHPNIVRVIAIGEWSRRPYIVFEYIEGVTLKEWARQEERSPRRIAELVIKLADAIQHAHEFSIVHRDLKPGNILLDESGEPHITDFGLARRLDDCATIAVDGTIMGTIPYMSPEQVAAEHDKVEPPSDIYALGVILYELLSGSLPFAGPREKLIHDIQFKDPPPLRRRAPDVSVDLETVCQKALQKKPADRYSNAAEFRDDLQRYLDGQKIHARRTPLIKRVLQWSRQNSLLIMTVLLLTMMTVLLSDLIKAPEQQLPARPEREPDANNEVRPDGTRLIRLETDPPGAEVIIQQYASKERWVLVQEIKHEVPTPVELYLKPGFYELQFTKDGLTGTRDLDVPTASEPFDWTRTTRLSRQ